MPYTFFIQVMHDYPTLSLSTLGKMVSQRRMMQDFPLPIFLRGKSQMPSHLLCQNARSMIVSTRPLEHWESLGYI